MVIEDGSGVTTISNYASGRNLRQEIDPTLTLPGFDAAQDGIVLERLGMHLAVTWVHAGVGG